MNANELADEIKNKLDDSESYYGDAESLLIKSETMLRQQQTEINAAEQQVLDAFERGKMFGYAQGLRKAQEK